MSNSYFYVPEPANEPVLSYAPGTAERAHLQEELVRLSNNPVEVPLIIGGREIRTGDMATMRAPHKHALELGTYHRAGGAEVEQAINAALAARSTWAALPWEQRVSIFLRAAELLAGPWRATLNAATVLGQSKTAHQAEIDSACELIDFLRFNAYYLTQIMAEQPASSSGVWNRVEYRPLEGFVFAVTPFNFTAIAGNLPTAPAMVGNVVVWKPASSAVLSAYYFMRLMEEAGLPPGVINFLPGSGRQVGEPAIASPDLAGIHFTGSTRVFQGMWKAVGDTISQRKYYPRIVGETGGKDFIFAHASSHVPALVVAALRGAFEYQGQKCSAASRLYLPRSLWPTFREKYVAEVSKITVGDPADFSNFMSAVIDRPAFETIRGYIEQAKSDPNVAVLTGGGCDDSEGYFIEPTTLVTQDPQSVTMCEEIFGPVLTIYVYEDDDLEETLRLCNDTSPYALTGAIFGRDGYALAHMSDALRDAAGNFYINDKPTGAVVGQQPFGGARASGTNDKAGSAQNLQRWLSVRTIKETLSPPASWRYPFMDSE
ncbi:MAG: L-glutamate gamma-semialdehyde dehydrogenase [Ardenticatenaceae bacterium]|nr:L-glutamate gamma-semialdehyde dehydrogenase [Ardenticatenaceae bacterium]